MKRSKVDAGHLLVWLLHSSGTSDGWLSCLIVAISHSGPALEWYPARHTCGGYNARPERVSTRGSFYGNGKAPVSRLSSSCICRARDAMTLLLFGFPERFLDDKEPLGYDDNRSSQLSSFVVSPAGGCRRVLSQVCGESHQQLQTFATKQLADGTIDDPTPHPPRRLSASSSRER
jgi:hypothetical protein